MKPAFFLRHFNDIDHIAPIMWRCLERGDDVYAILLDTNYPASEDPRLEFLTDYDQFHIEYVDSFLDMEWGSQLFSLGQLDGRAPSNPALKYLRKGLQKVGVASRLVTPTLTELDPNVCVFEWGSPRRTSHREFFEAATALDIPTICVPHGLNIYLNDDITPGRKKAFEQGQQTMASRNGYDAYVTQSEYDRQQEGTLGVDPDIHYVLGSTRYYSEWQAINEGLYDTYDPPNESTGSLKAVFMLPHWGYNVDKEQTLQLISTLADYDWLHLVIKEHTRGDSLPSELDDRLVRQDNTDVVADVSSVSLIKWADTVINFGSSIGIEALLQNKQLVNPYYLHSNRTIFEETNASHQPNSNDDSVATIEAIYHDNIEPVPEANKHELYRTVVYGGKDKHDVPETYRELLLQFASA
jgi:hypothetical protein